MKIMTSIILSLFALNAFGRDIDCTTRLMQGRTDQTPKAIVCGAVKVEAYDNGIKYRRQPRFCKKISVEFFSVRSTDERKFAYHCDKIFSENCYVIGIRDTSSHQGMGGLASHMVFTRVDKIPAVFNLGASGIGRKRGAIPGPGTIARIDLSCRAQ